MSDGTGSVEPFKRMMEDYYRGAASIPWHVPYIPVQWVKWSDLKKPFSPERFQSAEFANITEKQITDLKNEMERLDDSERKG
jgi:hypothetical protein